MAARLNPKNDERTRSTIQTTQLCKRLNFFALGLPEPSTGRPPEMTDTQVRAALGLLRKTLPDLAVTQLDGAVNGKLEVEFRWRDDPQPPVINGEAVEQTDDTPAITFIGE